MDSGKNALWEEASEILALLGNAKQEVGRVIVGMDEADLKVNKVSVTSPIARALIGKYAGDVVEVQAPAGPREYEILEVRYI